MILLCADDYGLTDGVSRGIGALAKRHRLSATSALVTDADWPRHVAALAALRGEIAVGLHLNLTLGHPLGRMPRLTPDGRFPGLGRIVRMALLGRIERGEIAEEFTRQIDRFEQTVGSLPDHIDGHQHVHALPIIRHALIDAIKARDWHPPPLVRNPADRLGAIVARQGAARPKAAIVAILSSGFGRCLANAGLPTNDSFAGFSPFDESTDYRDELRASMGRPGRCHLVMCHPGFADDALRALDPVVERRQQEYDALMESPGLPPRIWHPDRRANGPNIDWNKIIS